MNEFHPSKVFKFCMFCGATGFKWNGKNAFVCPTCNRKFYINMSSAVVAIIYNQKGELLLTRRKNEPAKGMLDLPGGFVNLGETVENAVVREVREELNIDVTELKFAGTFPNEYVFDGITYFTEDSAFVCKVADFSNITANDDVLSFEFKNIDEIDIDDIGLQSIKNVILKLNDFKNNG